MPEDSYSKRVLIGNWFEESLCVEEDIKDFLLKKDKNQLLMQKSAGLRLRAMERRRTSEPVYGCVHFGDRLMIQCMKDRVDREGRSTMTRPDLALSISPQRPAQLLQEKTIIGPCFATASPYTQPVMRNIFTICSLDGSKDGDRVRYGQSVLIRTPVDAGNLYLQGDRRDLHTFARESMHCPVNLVVEPSFQAQWQFQVREPRLRNEFQGAPVKANEVLLITNKKTNQNLNVEEAFASLGPYGKEYEVSCHRAVDSHRYELGTNHWVLRMLTADEDAELKYDCKEPLSLTCPC